MHAQGEGERARALYEEALALRRALGDRRGSGIVLGNLGGLAPQQGDLPRAERLFAEGLEEFRHLGEPRHIAWLLNNLAVEAMAGVGIASGPAAASDYERIVATARGQLGDEAFAAAWEAGRALPLEEAVAEALAAANDLAGATVLPVT